MIGNITGGPRRVVEFSDQVYYPLLQEIWKEKLNAHKLKHDTEKIINEDSAKIKPARLLSTTRAS